MAFPTSAYRADPCCRTPIVPLAPRGGRVGANGHGGVRPSGAAAVLPPAGALIVENVLANLCQAQK
jgi:hypothetical protein